MGSRNIPWHASTAEFQRAHRVTERAYALLNDAEELGYQYLSDTLADEAARCGVTLDTFIQALAVSIDAESVSETSMEKGESHER